MDITLQAVATGIGATLIMDIWAILQKRFFNIPSLDYRLVGRWVGHIFRGKFIHNTILKASPTSGEVTIGWLAHYVIGVIFACFMLLITGPEWLDNPTFLPAFITGIISLIAPFFIMQPGFGFGFAASKTPQPRTARLRSFIAHASFGVGLYISAQLIKLAIS